MFNELTVVAKHVDDFKRFLAESEAKSLKVNTPVSVGPYLSSDGSNTFLYVTHYASTKAFIQVMGALTFSGLSMLRARCTLRTSWTYCNPEAYTDIGLDDVFFIGVQGDPASFESMLNLSGIQPHGKISSIKNVRSKSLGHYYMFKRDPSLLAQFETFIQDGGAIRIYQASNIRK